LTLPSQTLVCFSGFLQKLLRFVYYLLYHSFAWTYDLVSGMVSLGHWNNWVKEVIPFMRGKKILELGFGPGHLQLELTSRGFQTFGLDESPQMAKLASRKLKLNDSSINLVRGLSLYLPFSSCFDTIVATFPSDYIFALGTIREITRALVPGGRLIVLLGVSPGNPNSRSKLANLLSNAKLLSGVERFNRKLEQLCNIYGDEGIKTDILRIPKGSVTLLVLLGEKSTLQGNMANIA